MVHEQLTARQKAVKILTNIFEKKLSLKLLIDDNCLNEFSRQDRAFLKELVYGVLRNLYYIDWLVEEFYKNKKGLSQKTINNLRCAVYQLIFMGLPPYAVINESVKMEKAANGKPSVVNGILRNFLRKNADRISALSTFSLKIPFNDIIDYLSLRYSHPKWLIQRWLVRFSKEETEALLNANNQKPPFTIAVKPEERNDICSYLNERGLSVKPTKYAPSGIIIQGQGYEIRKILITSDFFWIIQDEASQLACFFLEPQRGSEILDVCSSPGGKAMLTAALIKEGKITCLERDSVRSKILNQNIKRIKKFLPKVEFQILNVDALQFSTKKHFNRIILDAPCSSLGVVRRNPDVRYRCNKSELTRLSKNQLLLLEHCSKFLSKEGVLLYSVCSTEPEEGEEVIDKFLHKFSEFCTINSINELFRDFYFNRGFIRTYPHIHDLDGFFMARIALK